MLVLLSEANMTARLAGASSSTSDVVGVGRLELSMDSSTWGTVCGSYFGTEEVAVACRMLG